MSKTEAGGGESSITGVSNVWLTGQILETNLNKIIIIAYIDI